MKTKKNGVGQFVKLGEKRYIRGNGATWVDASTMSPIGGETLRQVESLHAAHLAKSRSK